MEAIEIEPTLTIVVKPEPRLAELTSDHNPIATAIHRYRPHAFMVRVAPDTRVYVDGVPYRLPLQLRVWLVNYGNGHDVGELAATLEQTWERD